MMVYAVLVILFGTFLQPITILFSLPLSIGGAIVALLLTGNQLTIPVWIGMLMLMGIVTKNAIMLVEFAIESIHKGMHRDAAIIDAGQKRARPIIMTTIAMVAGMMPSALSFGAGGEFRSPMALAVIGGLMFSTVLSLIFVPAMFAMMDDFSALCWRIGKRFISSGDEDEPAHARRVERPACGLNRFQADIDTGSRPIRGGIDPTDPRQRLAGRCGFDRLMTALASAVARGAGLDAQLRVWTVGSRAWRLQALWLRAQAGARGRGLASSSALRRSPARTFAIHGDQDRRHRCRRHCRGGGGGAGDRDSRSRSWRMRLRNDLRPRPDIGC